ncbi:MAG: 2-amino-4-hydroxy-6-hydroxymethyldihydropteridine diphosphokinase, partial [Spirochaeta sp.]|nr:2-amino-4-hydroxy-6-hydroxymethyldihydropteridine diphosphokinase [Spirochaeta sp.]
MSNHVLLSLGANLGNRQGNILQALQYMRARADINGISSFYETEPVGHVEQPKFINIACSLETELPPRELLSFLKWIEKRVGRRETFRNGPRSIDLDIIFYDDLVIDDDGLTIPHPRLQERAFVLLPLAEIAAEKIHPVLKTSVSELLEKIDGSGVQRLERSLRLRLDQDRQQLKPAVPVPLSRVGITNLQRIIRIEDKGGGNLFH